jgi:hypothetical protein
MNSLVAANVPHTTCQLPLRKKYIDQWPALVNTAMNLRVPNSVPSFRVAEQLLASPGCMELVKEYTTYKAYGKMKMINKH